MSIAKEQYPGQGFESEPEGVGDGLNRQEDTRYPSLGSFELLKDQVDSRLSELSENATESDRAEAVIKGLADAYFKLSNENKQKIREYQERQG